MKMNTLAKRKKKNHENSGRETMQGFERKSFRPLEVSPVTIKRLGEYLVNNEKAQDSNTV